MFEVSRHLTGEEGDDEEDSGGCPATWAEMAWPTERAQ